ncbi:hypothetical protein BLA29_002855 [Euroglyphus maynei]|uniref:Uncharacterized protein n=1 Tax=Euroglyphus maynei TaxID=6958 RepID=A0A1Y3BR69_EURMA|nr:hypothetical protein BLA29_002855 [Euroglyphus maynei]
MYDVISLFKMKPKVFSTNCGRFNPYGKQSQLLRSKKRKYTKLKLRTHRKHMQIVTNRKRSLYVELIDDSVAVLTIETVIIYTTIGHQSLGELKSRTMLDNHCQNLGVVSRYSNTDLVKLIYVKDIPKIVSDFGSGKSLNQIKYSSWPMLNMSSNIHDQSTLAVYNKSCDRLINRLFDVQSSLYMSIHRTTTFTNRVIKSISNLIGF